MKLTPRQLKAAQQASSFAQEAIAADWSKAGAQAEATLAASIYCVVLRQPAARLVRYRRTGNAFSYEVSLFPGRKRIGKGTTAIGAWRNAIR